jgi:hypothetical protein
MHHLYVVDLRGAAMVRRAIRETVARWLRIQRAVAPAGTRLSAAVYALHGDARAAPWPDGVEMIYPDDALGVAGLERVCRWACAAGRDVVEGEGRARFPEFLGVSVGRLNLDLLQGQLAMFGTAAATAHAALDRRPADRCTIVSGHAPAAAALERDLARRVPRVRAFSPPARRDRGHPAPDPDAPFVEALPDAASLLGAAAGIRPRALIVSDGPAMGAMFARVEQAMRDVGVGPVLRVQYGASEPPASDGGAAVARLPGTTADPRDVAAAAARWAAARDWFRELERDGMRERHAPIASMARLCQLTFVPLQVARVRDAVAVLDATRPELVIVGHDRWWGQQAYVLAARARGLPTVGLQDGTDGVHPVWYWLEADHIATAGETFPERLRAWSGVAPERVHVTGQPRYDAFSAPGGAAARAAARARLGLAGDAYWVLFAAQPGQDASYPRAVLRALLASERVRVVVRPHPSTPPGPYRALAAAAPRGRVVVADAAPMLDSLLAADAVVTQHSSVAVEAAMAGRPVICADFSGLPEVTPFVGNGVASSARDERALAALVARLAAGEALLDPAEVARGLLRLVGPPDGGAGARVAALVGELLAGAGGAGRAARR